MGSYGIGPARLIGTAVELFSGDKDILWPVSIAPFAVHLLSLDSDSKEVAVQAEEAYNALSAQGVEVLFDDRQSVRAGEKFADADLIGIPLRIIVSERAVKSGALECVNRRSSATKNIPLASLAAYINENL